MNNSLPRLPHRGERHGIKGLVRDTGLVHRPKVDCKGRMRIVAGFSCLKTNASLTGSIT